MSSVSIVLPWRVSRCVSSFRCMRLSVIRAKQRVGLALQLGDHALDDHRLDALLAEGLRQLAVDAALLQQVRRAARLGRAALALLERQVAELLLDAA